MDYLFPATFVRSVGLLRKKGRRWTLLFGRRNHSLDWLLRAKRLEPGRGAAAGAAGTGSQRSASN